jgi:hypothetical protein
MVEVTKIRTAGRESDFRHGVAGGLLTGAGIILANNIAIAMAYIL